MPEPTTAATESRRLALSEALGLGTGADWNAIVDRAGTVAAAAKERADLLEEARDALETAGQNGAHGDDWPAIAPAIRAIAADRDEARQLAENMQGRTKALSVQVDQLTVRLGEYADRGIANGQRAETAEGRITAALAFHNEAFCRECREPNCATRRALIGRTDGSPARAGGRG